eukprot:CAMPEP_0115039714 /NCGR_PEP_ID=MMETSP0216-20121206/44292_1 /TAXON_ID=223996 /ORGANISM="Protocruzia adherens, Strain Boccale" /LENGTH=330 /DNA_ID=CAMNT_0002420605 /DNA_START=486 /DNA_END=1478 /DNA_ORIENTATION=+
MTDLYLIEEETTSFCSPGCSRDEYYSDYRCKPCDESCSGCVGPSSSECITCTSGYRWISQVADQTSAYLGHSDSDNFRTRQELVDTSTEVHEFCSNSPCIFPLSSHVISTSHPYCPDMNVVRHFRFTHEAVEVVSVEFSPASSLEVGYDILSFTRDEGGLDVIQSFYFEELSSFSFAGNGFYLRFSSDPTLEEYGFDITITPLSRDSTLSNLTCTQFANRTGDVFTGLQSRIVESPHPYCWSLNVEHLYQFTSSEVKGFKVVFDPQSSLEAGYDYLIFSEAPNQQNVIKEFRNGTVENFDWPTNEFYLYFYSDAAYVDYGFKFEVIPLIK